MYRGFIAIHGAGCEAGRALRDSPTHERWSCSCMGHPESSESDTRAAKIVNKLFLPFAFEQDFEQVRENPPLCADTSYYCSF
jgi:hypothetical protein